MKKEMAQSGRSDAEIDQFFSTTEEVSRLIAEGQAGYAGWLVTNPAFGKSVSNFRQGASAHIDKLEQLPALQRSVYGQALEEADDFDPEFFAQAQMFCRHWSIDRLTTWDLPVPMDAQLTQPTLYELDQVGPAGVVLFVPWYLLRDKKLTIAGLASVQRTYSSPNQLATWLDRQPKNLGIKRYGIMLQLYVCLELALNRRYPGQLRSKLELFDEAFSST